MSHITTEKWHALRKQLDDAGIAEIDLKETFVRGAGKGGQKQNKTASCVDLLHLPSGIRVKCQDTRDQDANRFFARRRLLEAYRSEVLGVKTKDQLKQEKIAKQKKRRKRRNSSPAT